MDVRIGVQQSLKEIEVELPGDADREAVKKHVAEALADDSAVLWLTDKNGKDFAISSSKISYVEIGHPESERRIGFSA